MAGVASAGRLLRLILSRKIYLTTHDPAAHLASLFAIVTATSRNLQHLRGRRRRETDGVDPTVDPTDGDENERKSRGVESR